MNNNLLKISIVIPSFNQGQFLEDTLNSIINQNYDNVEIIVMDGGSTDNSISVIKKYEPYITYWQSQNDNGQSDAINNGFHKATGEFVTWLNSDDVLISGTLHKVNEYVKIYPEIDWFLGNAVWMDNTGKIIKVGKMESQNNFWNSHHLFSNGGPSAFMRKLALIEVGMLREDFHYMMDTELWHRLIEKGHLFVRINKYCWGLRLHEEAKMSGHNFANSPLADKKHSSWTKKMEENIHLNKHYPINKLLKFTWRFSKLFDWNVFSRLYDRKYIDKSYIELDK